MITEKHNCNGVDVMKLIMSLFIVLLHTDPLVDFSRPLAFAIHGVITRIAVPFFFIASGYFLFLKQNYCMSSFKYVVNKYLKRIFCIYTLWTLVYIPAIIIEDFCADYSLTSNIIITFKRFVFSGSYFHLWFLESLIVAVILVYVFDKYFNDNIAIVILSLFYCVALIGISYHGLWNAIVLKNNYVIKVISAFGYLLETPRNGIFFGAIFVFIGKYIAKRNIEINESKCKKLFVLSFFMLFVEAGGLKYFNLIRDQDVYIMLVPTCFLLFMLSKHWLSRKNCYGTEVFIHVRKISMLIFYIHPYFILLIKYINYFSRINSLLRCLIVLVASLISAELFIRKSDRYTFLKKFI